MNIEARNKEQALGALKYEGKQNIEDVCVRVVLPYVKHKVLSSEKEWDDMVYMAGEKTAYDLIDKIDGEVDAMPTIEPKTLEEAKEELKKIGKEMGEDVLLEGVIPYIKFKAQDASEGARLIYMALEKPIYELADKVNPHDNQ